MLDSTLLLQKLIQTPSVNGAEAKIAAIIQTKLADFGIKSELINYAPNRQSLIAEIGPKTSPTVLGLTGHMDIVSPGDLTTWHHPPFAGEISEHYLYGRGAADMKSGIVALVFAFIGLNQHPEQLTGRVRLMLTVGEENGAQGSHQLTKLHFADDLSGLIVGEPTDGNIICAHRGALNYTITSHGKQVHASTPELGINAITGLFIFAQHEANLFDATPTDPILGAISHAITIINAGDQINNIPARATLRGNIRPIPAFDNTAVALALDNLVTKINNTTPYNLTLTIDNSFIPVKTPVNAPLVLAAKEAITTITNQPATIGVFNGATDASEFSLAAKQFDTIILGPGSDNMSHQIDEYVDLNQLEQLIKVYQQLVSVYFSKYHDN